MAWLVRDATVLASLEIADSFRSRLKGLLGRSGITGALLLRPARSVHTIGMRFAIDVAYCDGDLRVLHLTTLRPYRIGRPVRHACVIIEAEHGAFELWGLAVGDELAVHGDEPFPPRSLPSFGDAEGADRFDVARQRLRRRVRRVPEDRLRAVSAR